MGISTAASTPPTAFNLIASSGSRSSSLRLATSSGTLIRRNIVSWRILDALLITDFQNDFTPGGALAVEGGDEIGEPINRLADHFDFVVATRDWHPPDHGSFVGVDVDLDKW